MRKQIGGMKKRSIRKNRKQQRRQQIFERCSKAVLLICAFVLFGSAVSKNNAFSADVCFENAAPQDEAQVVTTLSSQHSELIENLEETEKAEIEVQDSGKGNQQTKKLANRARQKAQRVKSAEKLANSKKVIWTGWYPYESGEKSYSQAGGDSGHAYGKYQLDDRYGLAGFLKYCRDYDDVTFNCFRRYVREKEDGTPYLVNLETLPDDWNWLCYTKSEIFYKLQTEYVVVVYYELPKQRLLESKSIDLDQYGPVLKGTVLSCAVRNGNYLENLAVISDTYYSGISEQEWLERIYAAQAVIHPDQAERWAVNQKNSAIEALATYGGLKELVVADLEEKGFEEVIK